MAHMGPTPMLSGVVAFPVLLTASWSVSDDDPDNHSFYRVSEADPGIVLQKEQRELQVSPSPARTPWDDSTPDQVLPLPPGTQWEGS